MKALKLTIIAYYLFIAAVGVANAESSSTEGAMTKEQVEELIKKKLDNFQNQDPRLGNESANHGFSTVTLGESAKARQNFSIAIGSDATASIEGNLDRHDRRKQDISIGFSSEALAGASIALGSSAKTDETAYSAIAIGSGAFIQELTDKNGILTAEHVKKVVTVPSNDVSGGNVNAPNQTLEELRTNFGATYGSVAIGLKSSSHNVFATSLGAFATAVNATSTAIGSDSAAFNDGAVAVGNYAESRGKNSVALGTQSETKVISENTHAAFTEELNNDVNAGVVSIGNDTIKRRIVNVAGGSEETDAVNVAQLTSVNTKVDNNTKNITQNATNIESNTKNISANATNIANNTESINGITKSIKNLSDQSNSQITHINNRLNTLDRDMKKGFARQSALAGLIPPMGVGRFNVTGAFGGSGSETAIAIGGGYRPNDHWNFRMGLSTNTSSGGRLDYNVAGSYEW